MITGSVRDVVAGVGLAGWTVQVFGPTTTSTTTDANGNYVLSGLAAGDYVVCEVVQSGWTQVSPTFAETCASKMGYNFSVPAGGEDDFVNFGNQTP